MSKNSILLGVSGFFVIVAALFFVFLYSQAERYRTQILPNITVDHISVGGMSKTQATEALKKFYSGKDVFTLSFLLDSQYISTISATDIDYQYPITDIVNHAYLIGRESHTLSSLYQFIALIVGFEHYNFEVTPQFDQQFITKHITDLNNAYLIPAQDARFVFDNNKVSAFQIDKPGTALDTNFALSQTQSLLLRQKTDYRSKLAVLLRKTVLQPKVKLSDINKLGITELVAEGSSQFEGSHTERVHNIVTGASKINGTIIYPGETFSFDKTVGEVSQATGFWPAFVISQGRTVLGDGGGICQVSTTLYRAALHAGLPIDERHAHAYRVGYYEQDAKPGLDATIFVPSVDLKFTNNYSHALLIQSQVDEDNLTMKFQLFGTKDTRVVEISEPVVWNIQPAPPAEYQDDFTLPVGVTKQVDFAASGASSKYTYKVTRDNTVLTQQEFVSYYTPWKAIFLVGKKT